MHKSQQNTYSTGTCSWWHNQWPYPRGSNHTAWNVNFGNKWTIKKTIVPKDRHCRLFAETNPSSMHVCRQPYHVSPATSILLDRGAWVRTRRLSTKQIVGGRRREYHAGLVEWSWHQGWFHSGGKSNWCWTRNNPSWNGVEWIISEVGRKKLTVV